MQESTEEHGAAASRWPVRLLALSVVASVVLQLRWAILRSPTTLMRHAPADDAFYYLVLAEHAPRPVFSGEILTTGFHPLYWILLAPLTAVFDGISGVRAALVLGTIAYEASGVILFFALRRRHRELPALGAAALWLLLPGVRAVMLMGVESAVLACALSVVLLIALKHPAPTRAVAAGMGVAVGAAFLARTDSVLMTAPIVLLWAWQGRERGVWRTLVVTGGAALALAVPWLVYVLSQGAGLSTDAMRAFEDPFSLRTFLDVEVSAVSGTFRLVTRLYPAGPVASGAMYAVVLLVGVVTIRALLRSRDAVAFGVLAGAALTFLAYGAVSGYTRSWYYVYPLFAFCAVVVPVLVEAVPRRPAPYVVGAAVLAAVLVPGLRTTPQEADKYQASLVAQDLLPDDARIGAFNSGIYQFFMRQDVVNLDGVVNPDVQPYRRSGQLCDYLQQQGIEYLIDTPRYIREAQEADPRIQVADTVDLSARYDPDGGSVAQEQVLVTLDLSGCAPAPG